MKVLDWFLKEKGLSTMLITHLISNSIRAFLDTFGKAVIAPASLQIHGLRENESTLISGFILLFLNAFIIYMFCLLFMKRDLKFT